MKAGVVLDGLEPPGRGQQLGLFDALATPPSVPVPPARTQQLMQCLDALNQRFGRGAVRPAATVAAAGEPTPWQGKFQHRSPAYTTRLEECLVVP